ncbi:MAG: HEPN domain-containing protein [Actinobacteria bacterium]|nr:HEPN domain-containing protein [Actinomycetota bacterium]
MSSWPYGRATVVRLLQEGSLEIVTANTNFAKRLCDEADRHLKAVQTIIEVDPSGAFQLAYDAARKACSALLAQQGLRATHINGHKAISDLMKDQFSNERKYKVLGKLNSLRRSRADSQYPSELTPSISVADATYCYETSLNILKVVNEILGSGQLNVFSEGQVVG